jgi:putative PIN family toxin of toxin-antitoxin system
MKNNRIVVDTNVFISALLIKKSIPFQVVNIAFKLGKILYSDATYAELQQVLFRRKFDKYLTLEERNIFLFKLANDSPSIEIQSCRDVKLGVWGIRGLGNQ